MSSILRGRLTRATKKLKDLLRTYEEEVKPVLSAEAEEFAAGAATYILQWREKVSCGSNVISGLIQELVSFVGAIENEDQRIAEERKAIESLNSDGGPEDVLELAREVELALKLRLDELERGNQEAQKKEDVKTLTRHAVEEAAVEAGQDASVVDRRGFEIEHNFRNGRAQVNHGNGAPENGRSLDIVPGQNGGETIVSFSSDNSLIDNGRNVSTAGIRECITAELPRLKLPVFEGTTSDFLRFWSLFEAIVDKRREMDTSLKLHYLLGSLKGEAARLVSGFAFDGRNYENIKATLRERYGSKETTERRLFEELYSIKADTTENALTLSDQVESILN